MRPLKSIRIAAAGLVLAAMLTVLGAQPASASPVTPGYVQGASTYAAGSASSISQLLPGNTTAGDLLIVTATWHNTGATTMTCSDNGDGVYSTAVTYRYVAGNQSIATCYARAVYTNAGSPTVTATFSGATTSRGLVVGEYSGIAASPIDQSNGNGGNVGTGANAMTTTAVTTTSRAAPPATPPTRAPSFGK